MIYKLKLEKTYKIISLNLIVKSISNMIEHEGVEHAGYLSFLALLSLFPFLVFLVSILGYIGQTSLGIEYISFFLDNLPKDVATVLEPRIEEITSGPPQSLLTLAVIGVIWTASSAVEGLRTILNKAYRVQNIPPYLFRRLLSVLQFLAITFIGIVTMVTLVILPIIIDKIIDSYNISLEIKPYWHFLKNVSGFVILFFLISLIYYIVPNVNLKFRHVFVGAFLVVLLWLLFVNLFTLYLKNFNQFNLVYGSIGGVIVTLIFFYILSMILIWGAEFNYQLQQKLCKAKKRHWNYFLIKKE